MCPTVMEIANLSMFKSTFGNHALWFCPFLQHTIYSFIVFVSHVVLGPLLLKYSHFLEIVQLFSHKTL